MESFGYFQQGSNRSAWFRSPEAAGDYQFPCGFYRNTSYFNVGSISIKSSRPYYSTTISTKGAEKARTFNIGSLAISTKQSPRQTFITPRSIQFFTNGPKIDKTVVLKGPTIQFSVENTSTENEIGSIPTNVNAFKLNLAVGQFIAVKVDINGAKINNLPSGFVFTNGEISGAPEAAGIYKFNIVSGNASIPVTFEVSNVIRIA